MEDLHSSGHRLSESLLFLPGVSLLDFILFYGIKAATGLRVTEEEEQAGLDYEEHGASAYPDFNVSAIR